MGYLLTELSSLPVDEGVNLYIFVLGNGLHSPEYEETQKNFLPIAHQIGKRSIIVQGTDTNKWTDELKDKYLGGKTANIVRLLPALLLTDTHPEHLHSDSFRMVIPLRSAKEKYGDLAAFFAELISFTKGDNPEFLASFTEDENSLIDALEGANKVIIAKPAFLGFGLNFNAAVEQWIEKRRGKRHA